MNSDSTTIGLLYSGGLDSSVLLAHLLRQGQSIQPLFIRGGAVWESAELHAAQCFLAAVARPELCPMAMLDLPLTDLYGDHWSLTGRGVPSAASDDEAVYLPGRNLLLLTKAAVWCRLHGIASVALAVLGSSPFDDAKTPFFASFEAALATALGGCIRVLRPFDKMGKQQVMELGRDLPLELTFSCLSPIGLLHCGRCNKCTERRRAFDEADREDKTRYAG